MNFRNSECLNLKKGHYINLCAEYSSKRSEKLILHVVSNSYCSSVGRIAFLQMKAARESW